jgi:hypothetical protein
MFMHHFFVDAVCVSIGEEEGDAYFVTGQVATFLFQNR